MSETIIRVENIGKKYIIDHQQSSYNSLRDKIAGGVKALGKRLLHPSKSKNRLTTEEFWALKDISFEVKRGDRIGIIGRNGAGKSTLLKILSRITEPTTGRITLNGRVASLLEVGTGFHPELTGRENIYLNGAILGMSRVEIKKKFDEIVAFAEVEQFLDTPVKRYSSGMYVRLAFAVAAHLEPEILIVDEVLAVGDAQFQKKCLGKMEDVATQSGRTILFVSHNMGAINVLCNQVIYLRDRQIRAMGEANTVVNQYLSELLKVSTASLKQFRVSGYGQKVRFQSIKLIGEHGGNVRFGNAIQYQLKVFSETALEDLSIGSSVYTLAGTCIGTLFAPKKFAIAPHQELTLSLSIESPNLAPGSYYSAFSIGQGDYSNTRYDFDIVVGYPSFQILSISSQNSQISNWHANWGNIVFQNTTLTLDRHNSDLPTSS